MYESRTRIKLAYKINNYTAKQQKNNRLFIPVKNTNNLKQNLKEFRVRENHSNRLYWFTLKPRAKSSPQKPLGKPLCNQTKL